jgi:hypothetical protein
MNLPIQWSLKAMLVVVKVKLRTMFIRINIQKTAITMKHQPWMKLVNNHPLGYIGYIDSSSTQGQKSSSEICDHLFASSTNVTATLLSTNYRLFCVISVLCSTT